MPRRQQSGGKGFMPTQQPCSDNSKSTAALELILDALSTSSEIDRRKFLRRQRSPSILYKFKAVNLEKPHILEDIIVNSRLYLSSPESFNDPFDMKPRVSVKGDLSSLITMINSLRAPSLQAKQDAIRKAQTIFKEHGWPGISNEFRIQESAEAVPIRKVVRSGCLNCAPLSSLHQFVP